ncbi:MAG TPA: hypothetical protein VIH69_06865 [Dehalococcoidia bacterium]
MSTKGVGVYGINSVFASGSLVFYEKAVGRTATGDVFTVGTAAVKVGGTAQDVDFQFYGTGSLSAIIDTGAATFTLTGIATTMIGALTVGVDDTGHDVKFFGATSGAYLLWDESDDALEFSAGANLTMSTTSKLVIPVKASGSTTAGDLWLDTTDSKLHFYNGSAEKTVTDS